MTRRHGSCSGPCSFCDDVPFAAATEIRGHAVRALYLLSGATDVYTANGDPALLRAALAQWDDMVAGKLYLTGGAGSRHKRESFGDAYELPPDRAYWETCAAIASIMWNWRMLLVTGEARFAALMERTLCNGFLAGLGRDGTSFFYVNPLQARSPVRRQPWYQCACCPPNGMRLLASLGHYMATSTGTGVQIHQYASGRLRAAVSGGELELELATGYPYQGELLVRVLAAPGAKTDLAIRLPGWAGSAALAVNRREQAARPGRRSVPARAPDLDGRGRADRELHDDAAHDPPPAADRRDPLVRGLRARAACLLLRGRRPQRCGPEPDRGQRPGRCAGPGGGRGHGRRARGGGADRTGPDRAAGRAGLAVPGQPRRSGRHGRGRRRADRHPDCARASRSPGGMRIWMPQR